MKFISIVAVFSLIFSSVTFANSEAKSASGALAADSVGAAAQLTKLLKDINSLKGEFEQVLRDKNGNVVQKSAGNFTLKRPGYFLWESLAPYEQVVIGNPETLWVYDPDLEQVTVRTQDLSTRGNPARLLSGDFEKMAEHYTISANASEKGKTFVLQPHTPLVSNFTDIAFSFENAQLNHLTFKDSLGQETILTLQNTQVNVPVDTNVFDFVAPEGTDIIVDDE